MLIYFELIERQTLVQRRFASNNYAYAVDICNIQLIIVKRTAK